MNETDYERAGPRGWSRIQDWLAARGQRIPPEAWPFILLALFAVAANGQMVLSSGSLYLLLLPSVAAGALLPAAILIGCRDAWRSARLLLLGAIVWTSIPFVLDVVSWAQQWLSPEQWPDPSVFSGLQIGRDLGSIASLSGPALVAIALMQRRRTETTWPKALVAVTLIATGVLCLLATNSAISVPSETTIGVDPDYAWFVAVVALRPLQILTVGALAWSTLAAVRAREEPRRFWSLVFAGSAVMLCTYTLLSSLNLTLASPALGSDTYLAFLDQIVLVDILGVLVGMVLLLIGFAQGLPAVATMAGGEEALAIPDD